MKKIALFILTIIVGLSTLLVGCNDSDKINVYSPDGAPALSLIKVIKKDFKNVNVNIVSADKIGVYIAGDDKKADICILPVNMASKLIGDGKNYKMIATITHGNFYFLSKNSTEVNRQNLINLVGKTIGVMQLQNVPGLTLKSVFNDLNIDYEIIQDSSQKKENKVNLMGINKVETAREDIDLFLIPSPQADLKELTTDLNIVGSLGEIYSENGFPQAIIVVKNSLLNENLAFVKNFANEIKGVNNFLNEQNKGEILTLLNSKIESGLTPVFNENTLTNKSIERSKIEFVSAKNSNILVQNFIQKLKKIEPNSVNEFNENFFYEGDL